MAAIEMGPQGTFINGQLYDATPVLLEPGGSQFASTTRFFSPVVVGTISGGAPGGLVGLGAVFVRELSKPDPPLQTQRTPAQARQLIENRLSRLTEPARVSSLPRNTRTPRPTAHRPPKARHAGAARTLTRLRNLIRW